MRIPLCFCLVALTAESSAVASTSLLVGSAWTEYSGSCYLLLDAAKKFEDAADECDVQGGSLAELDSSDELLAVNQMMLSAVTEDVWVGLEIVNGAAVWQSGLSLDSTSPMWVSGEPNLSGKCVRLTRFYPVYVPQGKLEDLGSHKLADIGCNTKYRPLCEKSSSQTTSHSTRLLVLPDNLCAVSVVYASTLLQCAQACTQHSTSCYVYAFENSTSLCTFHRLGDSCSQSLRPSVQYYRLTRKCA